MNVAKCEQFLNLGGGQTVVHSIIVIFSVCFTFLKINIGVRWEEVIPADCPDLRMSVRNTREASSPCKKHQGLLLEIKISKLGGLVCDVTLGLGKKAVISQCQSVSLKH